MASQQEGKQVALVKPNTEVVRVHEATYTPPPDIKTKLLHEHKGLCAWVGKERDDKILDSFPIFTYNELQTKRSVTACGIVLLVDLLRDLQHHTRTINNFSLPNKDRISEWLLETHGLVADKYLKQHWFDRRFIGTKNARFIAARIERILKANYLGASSKIDLDGSRIALKKPFTVLCRIDPNTKVNSLYELIELLGNTWCQAEDNLLSRLPELKDRTDFFSIT